MSRLIVHHFECEEKFGKSPFTISKSSGLASSNGLFCIVKISRARYISLQWGKTENNPIWKAGKCLWHKLFIHYQKSCYLLQLIIPPLFICLCFVVCFIETLPAKLPMWNMDKWTEFFLSWEWGSFALTLHSFMNCENKILPEGFAVLFNYIYN